MRAIRILSASCLALLALSAVSASALAAKLVLRSAGTVVAPGTGAVGTLHFGPCGSFKSSGKLTNNGAMVDEAVFTSFESNPGGCGEGGPTVTGKLQGIKLSGKGLIQVTSAIVYKTLVPQKCEYTLAKLKGTLALPGPASGQVSGTAKRVVAGSEKGCKGALKLTGEEAALEDLETGVPFEAET